MTDGVTARPARGNLTARSGKSGYGLRTRGTLEQPCSEEGHNRITPPILADRDISLSGHIAQLHTIQPKPARSARSVADEYVRDKSGDV